MSVCNVSLPNLCEHDAGKAVPSDTSFENEGDSDITLSKVLVDECEVASHSEMIETDTVV